MSDKVKIGILGCANIAERYAIKAFQAIENAEVLGIASRDYAKAKEWASRFGISAENSYDSLLLNPDVDAVYIPLPIGLHKEWILKAVAAGKHVICEKSLTGDFESAKQVVELCRSGSIVLYENFMCDFHPQHGKVLSLIQGGSIGEPEVFKGYFGFPLMNEKNFRYNKNLGGGSLNDAGAYTVFMARKIFGKEPVSADCSLFYGAESGVDMRGSAMLKFSDGETALIAFSFDSMYQNNYSVWGREGLLSVDRAYSIPPEMKPDIALITNKGSKESTVSVDVPAANHFELIFQDFCDTVLNKKDRADKISKTYSQLISQAKALEAMRVSARENRTVKLTEIS
jgi:NDP-hexose-3-ketoreductase